MASIDDVLTGKKPRRRSVVIVLDADARPPQQVEFTFQALPRHEWDDLIKAHPASDEAQNKALQDQAARGVPPSKFQRLRWNDDTFYPAALAASCVDPAMTVEQATELYELPAINESELFRMLGAMLAANESAEGTTIWGKGFVESRVRDQLTVARQYHLPLSIVLGRPWPAPGEPLWLPEDLDAAVAFEDYLAEQAADRCPGCRTRRSDWFDAEGRQLRDPPYVVETFDCPGCRQLASEEPGAKDPARKWKHAVLVPYRPNDHDTDDEDDDS